jgi:hypothetical protein
MTTSVAQKETTGMWGVVWSQPYMCLFFVLFIVEGSFFIWNLFVGVTIDKFNEMKDKQEGRSVFLTEEQRIWVSIQKLVRTLLSPCHLVDANRTNSTQLTWPFRQGPPNPL